MVRFKTGLSHFINRLSLMSNLKLLVSEAKTSKSSKLMTQSHCKRWSEPMLNEERTYVECTELWKNHTGSVYQQYQDLMKHKDSFENYENEKLQFVIFQTKQAWLQGIPAKKWKVNWPNMTSFNWPNMTWSYCGNAWMDNHFVKFQSNQTIFQ